VADGSNQLTFQLGPGHVSGHATGDLYGSGLTVTWKKNGLHEIRNPSGEDLNTAGFYNQSGATNRDNDGTIDILYSYTYLNPTGPDVISAFDEDNDGEPEYTTEYRYDINEDLIYYENHTGDEWSIYEYERNVDGDTTRQFGTVKLDGQGPYDYDSTFEYEAPGRISSSTTFYDFDGATLSYEEQWIWTCPAA
jgi:hypothetical protein